MGRDADGDEGMFSSNPLAWPQLHAPGSAAGAVEGGLILRPLPWRAGGRLTPLSPPHRALCIPRWTPRAAPGTTAWWSECSGTHAG